MRNIIGGFCVRVSTTPFHVLSVSESDGDGASSNTTTLSGECSQPSVSIASDLTRNANNPLSGKTVIIHKRVNLNLKK